MEKSTANHRRPHAFLHFAPAFLLVLALLLSADVQKAECLTTAPPAAEGGCNGTGRIADCLPDGEEFLMESETSRRLLVGARQTFSPGALQPKKPFCDGTNYGSCIPGPNKFYDSENRNCNHNTCKRAPK
ncbi:UNVERIFIED_CONTAM: hypothetical protein Sradi_0804300 [Sesamum radiatum]|uniref:Uncharacterized protein n=1 Tax=Sesamum radiatum TaxID=300843 RepID=A0AAW2VR22_SESRA